VFDYYPVFPVSKFLDKICSMKSQLCHEKGNVCLNFGNIFLNINKTLILGGLLVVNVFHV